MSARPAHYTHDDADQDAAHLAVLLDMLVFEECNLVALRHDRGTGRRPQTHRHAGLDRARHRSSP